MATEIDIDWCRGEDVAIEVTVAMDLTGDSLAFAVKHLYADAAALITKTTSSGITLVSASSTQSVYRITVPSADSNQTAREYRWATGRTTLGKKAVFARGKLTIKDDTFL